MLPTVHKRFDRWPLIATISTANQGAYPLRSSKLMRSNTEHIIDLAKLLIEFSKRLGSINVKVNWGVKQCITNRTNRLDNSRFAIYMHNTNQKSFVSHSF